MEKTIIYGGSFNPVTNAHIQLAEYATHERDAGDVIMAITANHAFDKELAPITKRIWWLAQSIKGKDIKTDIMGRYMWDYINTLDKEKEYVILCGSDILHEIEKWYNYKQLIQNHEFWIAVRGKLTDQMLTKLHKYRIISSDQSRVSSTQVREYINRGESIDTLVPECIREEVESYYKSKGV